MFLWTTGFMTTQCIPLIELLTTVFTVVNKGFGKMFGLDMILNIVFRFVWEGSTDWTDPRVKSPEPTAFDINIEITKSSQHP